MASTDHCFHCLLPNPPHSKFIVEIGGRQESVCCPGCQAVAELIRDSGLDNYYAVREDPIPGLGRPEDNRSEWQAFNSEDMLRAFAEFDGERAIATIYVGGMYCSACSWLIETSLKNLSGVHSVVVNPMTHRVRVEWTAGEMQLGDILSRLAGLGYRPQPLTPDDTSRPEVAEQRTALKRLLVSSLGMMQVMMFAVGLYAGDYQGMDADMQHFLRLVSFFVATPVVFYAAKPFFVSAWRGVVTRMPGMDLPVSIAIGSAYAASVYATFTRGPAVWFDSVAMFVFFLTLGRYLEMRARHRSIDHSAALSQSLPNTATLITDHEQSVVPASNLVADDRVLIRPGDSIPADGTIMSGKTTVDEALLTGEADPQPRIVGDDVAAGSMNIAAQIEVSVVRAGNDTMLGAISRMSERARYARPAFVKTADKIASLVVVALLLVATCVAIYWGIAAPERAFEVTLSVLVVTCPCALALATPASFAAAGSRLAQLQILLTDGDAIEVLQRATHVIFDKTGTLTSGLPTIDTTTVFDANYSAQRCMTIAAALQQVSSHPIANAFREVGALPTVCQPDVHVGEGVSGNIDQHRWRLGKASFALSDAQDSSGVIVLSKDKRHIASFQLQHRLRPDAETTIAKLRSMGLELSLLSGDQSDEVRRVADKLQIANWRANCTPEDKLDTIKDLQDRGNCVVMVGDGMNDAPVLAAADASITPIQGSALAQTHADIILLGNSLEPLLTAFRLSQATLRVVRQNLVWAVVYNIVALPLAASGLVAPWLAAIGMSASSLVVVVNALRLNRMS